MDLYIFKDRLNEALKYRNMTASELSRLSGLDKGSISRYLKGENIPRTAAVNKIAEALKVNPSWLIGYSVEMTAEKGIRLDENKLLIEVDKLSPENKEKLREFFQFLLSRQKEEQNNDSDI